jgi:hypothetical protein
MDDVRSSEKCEAHLLQLFALSISPSALCLVPVLCGLFEFSKNRRLWSFEVCLNLSFKRAVDCNSLKNQKNPYYRAGQYQKP